MGSSSYNSFFLKKGDPAPLSIHFYSPQGTGNLYELWSRCPCDPVCCYTLICVLTPAPPESSSSFGTRKSNQVDVRSNWASIVMFYHCLGVSYGNSDRKDLTFGTSLLFFLRTGTCLMGILLTWSRAHGLWQGHLCQKPTEEVCKSEREISRLSLNSQAIQNLTEWS